MSTRIPHLTDHKEAGLRLATRLQRFLDHVRSLVLALLRGGVEVGFMISTQLQLPLDVFLTRKLGYPGHSEYARGAITETVTYMVEPGRVRDGTATRRRGIPGFP